MWETAPKDVVVCAGDPAGLHNQIIEVGPSLEGHRGPISSLALQSKIWIAGSNSQMNELLFLGEIFRPPGREPSRKLLGP